MTRDWWQQFSGLSFEGTNGTYTLGALRGVGGFGAVFEATSRRFPHPVAIKLVIPGADEFDAQFRELVRSLQIRHPSLVHTLDCGTTTLTQGRFLYIAMELGSGTLEDALSNNPLPPAEALRMAVSIAGGLAYLHQEHRLVHRDLKPANVLRVGDAWKLTDYGVARTVDTKSAARTSRVVGTVDYMPPESFDGFVSPAWDVWAFGVLVTRTLTGRKAFGGETPTEVMRQIVMSTPDLTFLPEPWQSLVASCLQRDPARRPAAAQLVAQLTAPAPAPRPEPKPEPKPAPKPEPKPKPPSKLLRRLGIAAGVLVLLAAAIAGIYWYQEVRFPDPASVTEIGVAESLASRAGRDAPFSADDSPERRLALTYYDRALALAGPTDEAANLRIRSARTMFNYYHSNDCAAVINDATYILERDPNFWTFEYRAGCYTKTANTKAALADYERAIQAAASDPSIEHYARRDRARLLIELGRKREAAADIDRLERLNPSDDSVKQLREKLAQP